MVPRLEINRSEEVRTVNRFGVSVVMALMMAMVSAAVSAEDLRDGFGGVPWGSSIDQLADFQKVGSKNRVDYYVNPGKRFTFEDVAIREVIYGFYEGRFFAAYLRIETLAVFQQLKHQIQTRYGPPLVRYAVGGQPAVYRWKEKNLKIKLKIDSAMQNMKLAFYYVPLADQVNEESQERYQEQGLRFLPIQPDRTPEMIPILEF